MHDGLCGSDHFPIFLNDIASGFEEPSEKWKLNKADWPSLKALCESEKNETILKKKDPIDNFTTILYDIAKKTIPKMPIKTKKKKKPWFNDDCKRSIQKKKTSFTTIQYLSNASKSRKLLCFFLAKANRTFRDSKRKSWKQCVSKLNSQTSIKKVWDMVRQIQGKGKSASVNHLKKNNTLVTSKKTLQIL